DLHRAARLTRQDGGAELEIEGLALPTEGAAHGRLDHADLRLRDLEHLRELAMQVVRDLRRGPERELSVRRPVCDGAVRLDRRVRAALVEPRLVDDRVGVRE